MTVRAHHVLIALLILAVIVALGVIFTQRWETARNACEQECHDQGLDQWIYDANIGDCRCFSMDPV